MILDRIQKENDIEEIHIRPFFVDSCRNKVRSAGVGAGLDQQRVAKAVDNAAHQRAKDGAGAIFRGISESGQIHIFQRHQADGKHRHINHASHSQGLVYLQVHPNRQRDVDHQAHIAHIDPRQILDHGADAVDTGRRKLIGEYKQVIIQRTNHGDRHDAQVCPYLFQPYHFLPPDERLYFV